MEWKPPRFQTARDTLEISVAPVIFSHSSAQALCNSARNVPDQLLKLTVFLFQMSIFGRSSLSFLSFQAAKNGLVMINFFSYFITCSNVSSINDAIDSPRILVRDDQILMEGANLNELEIQRIKEAASDAVNQLILPYSAVDGLEKSLDTVLGYADLRNEPQFKYH